MHQTRHEWERHTKLLQPFPILPIVDIPPLLETPQTSPFSFGSRSRFFPFPYILASSPSLPPSPAIPLLWFGFDEAVYLARTEVRGLDQCPNSVNVKELTNNFYPGVPPPPSVQGTNTGVLQTVSGLSWGCSRPHTTAAEWHCIISRISAIMKRLQRSSSSQNPSKFVNFRLLSSVFSSFGVSTTSRPRVVSSF